jgi:predicted nucleic acid-binding Zn ribbon protein
MESAAKVRESLAFAYWGRVAGAQAAAATEVEAVRDGILFVRTKSSVWSHELTLYKERLIADLNRLLGPGTITEIVYRARGVKAKAVKPAEPDEPAAAELDAVVLDAAEAAELEQSMGGLESIQSERIRAVVAGRMMRDAKLRHWRIEHGWQLCRRCMEPHKTGHALCPLCRLCR